METQRQGDTETRRYFPASLRLRILKLHSLLSPCPHVSASPSPKVLTSQRLFLHSPVEISLPHLHPGPDW